MGGARGLLWFPLAAAAGAAFGLWRPEALAGARPAIPWLLGLVMFGMGLNLRAQDFARVAARPGRVALGVLLQFGLMPAFAWAAARLFGLDPVLTAGMILVGACPGGTASNLVALLARADVALSVTLTAVSTVAAVLATPALVWLYLHQTVPVAAGALLGDVGRIVLLPVAAGLLANRLLGAAAQPLRRLAPMLSAAAIVFIIAIIAALNHTRLGGIGVPLALAVVAHNALGLAAGHVLGALLLRDRRAARTLAIEVGMQNSGLAVALALAHFGPAAALPGALFSLWHNLSGAALAAWWARRRADRG